MNSSTEISPSTQLLLDEICKLIDKFDARWAKKDASRGVLVPTQSAVVGGDVVADNWGGLFGGDDSVEQRYEAPIVADNWGGLLEPVSVLEEGVYVSTATDPTSPPPMKEQRDAVVVPDNWGGLFEQPAHIPELALSAFDANFGGLAPTDQIRIESALTFPVVDELYCDEASPLPPAHDDAAAVEPWGTGDDLGLQQVAEMLAPLECHEMAPCNLCFKLSNLASGSRSPVAFEDIIELDRLSLLPDVLLGNIVWRNILN